MRVKVISPRQGWSENFVGQELDVIRSTDLWYLSTNGIIGTLKADQVEKVYGDQELHITATLGDFMKEKNIELIAPNDIEALAPFLTECTDLFQDKRIITRQIDQSEIITVTDKDINSVYKLNPIVCLVSVYKTTTGIIEIKLTKNSLIQIIGEDEKKVYVESITQHINNLIETSKLKFGNKQDITNYQLSNFLIVNDVLECECIYVENEQPFITYVSINISDLN